MPTPSVPGQGRPNNDREGGSSQQRGPANDIVKVIKVNKQPTLQILGLHC